MKKTTTILLLIMAGILTAGILAGCSRNFQNNDSNNQPSSQQEDDNHISEVASADSSSDNESVETQPVDNKLSNDATVIVPESSEQPETEESELSIDNEIYQDIDNKALVTWLSTTEPPDKYGIYIWDAENETAIEVEDGKCYTITKMDELVIRCEWTSGLSPVVSNINYDPYVLNSTDLEMFSLYKLDNIENETNVEIRMLKLEDSVFYETDYITKFILQP